MADSKDKLFLLDAFALIYRAHFAFSKNPRINSKGFDTGCILGFTNTIFDVIKNEKPTHLAVCFDTPEPTVRHTEYPEYKAQREAQPEAITLSIPIIFDLLDALNIPVIKKPGFEADDVIGTIATQLGSEELDVYMMTSDKDYSQLVSEHVFLYKPNFMGKGVEVHDVPKVLEKWGIKRIDQVCDMLGLQGDAVDNIPGIPGIGPKTAQKLLEKYDTVENLVAHADELKGKQKENVINFGEQGILSKKLATIITDVPVEVSKDGLICKEADKELTMKIFTELEFRTLANRIFGEAVKTPSTKAKKDTNQMDLFTAANGDTSVTGDEEVFEETQELQTIATVDTQYKLYTDLEEIKALVPFILKQPEYCFDTETDNIEAIDANLVGISFSYLKGEAIYIACPKDRAATQTIVDALKPVFENDTILKIGQNIKYDLTVLKNYGVDLKGPLFDTMIAHYLLQPDMRHNMNLLAETYLNYSPVSIETLIGKKGKSQLNMADLSPEEVLDYACEDADITLQLKQHFAPQLEEKGLNDLFYKVEMPLLKVLAEMEYEGINLDIDALANMSTELEQASVDAQKKIFDLAGEEFNIASPKQLGEVLFDKMKLVEKPKKTKTGQYATGEDILSKLAADHEIISEILNFREYKKLQSTYVDALPKLINQKDKRIHTDYRQAVAATGRLSSNNPNLQNIPIRTEKGRSIRKAFIPRDKNYILYSADYSQIELRIMASFSEDKHMIEAFKNGQDIHATTASKVFGVPLDEVETNMRRKAKEVNFGIIYGISAFGLSQNLNIPRKEAAAIIEAYFEQFPAVKSYMDTSIENAREKGYAETILGRRRYLTDINSRNATQRGFAERNAINAPIQGSAADMIKIAMIKVQQWMKKEGLKSKMLLQVHDELVFDVYKSELALIEKQVPKLMAEAIKLNVPVEVGTGKGENWLEAH